MRNITLILLIIGCSAVGCQDAPETADAVEPTEVIEEENNVANNDQSDSATTSVVNLAVPEDWIVRLDRPNPDVIIGADPDTSDIYFVNMTPGWHITSGPAAIYYHPATIASDTYLASAEIHLFDPGDRTEAFGIFMGGANLYMDNQSYDYFLIRNSGEFLIKRRTGSETELIQDWTAHEAIQRFTSDTDESSVLNKLAIEVGEAEVSFMINDQSVATIAKTELMTDGIVGLRVNHALNVHISDLVVTTEI